MKNLQVHSKNLEIYHFWQYVEKKIVVLYEKSIINQTNAILITEQCHIISRLLFHFTFNMIYIFSYIFKQFKISYQCHLDDIRRKKKIETSNVLRFFSLTNWYKMTLYDYNNLLYNIMASLIFWKKILIYENIDLRDDTIIWRNYWLDIPVYLLSNRWLYLSWQKIRKRLLGLIISLIGRTFWKQWSFSPRGYRPPSSQCFSTAMAYKIYLLF